MRCWRFDGLAKSNEGRTVERLQAIKAKLIRQKPQQPHVVRKASAFTSPYEVNTSRICPDASTRPRASARLRLPEPGGDLSGKPHQF